MAREQLEEFRFLIPVYTPETIPLPRLMQYLAQIAAIVGEELSQDMHLIRVVKSSAKPLLKMPALAAARARQEAARVRNGGGTERQKAAFNQIRQMVRDDGRGKAAKLFDRTGVLLSFEPLSPAEPEVLATVRQPTTFDGRLLRIGGSRDQSTILMETLEGDIQSQITASRALAKQMAPLLYDPIRVVGSGVWKRNRDGSWLLDNMRVQHFEPLNEESMETILQRLGQLNVQWPDDADEMLQREREDAL